MTATRRCGSKGQSLLMGNQNRPTGLLRRSCTAVVWRRSSRCREVRWLWSHKPGRDLRLAFEADVADAADYTLQVGALTLEFPAGSSGASTFKWTGVDVDWQDEPVSSSV